MCGISGYYGPGNREILQSMNDAISYRGPDDEGFYVGDNIGLAQRRLSIIDLSPGGHQPMSNESGDVWIVFNGEIYNHQALRQTLTAHHIFRGRSDTEVIIHLYEEIGEEIFQKIDGMFAIALYDARSRKLLLARDRMGKKPLYYAVSANGLIFGSELKALMPHPSFDHKLSLPALEKFLQFEYVPTPHTIFQNSCKLEPGHYLSFDGREAIKKKFWDLDFSLISLEAKQAKSEQRLLADFDELLDSAVKRRLESDVPLGIFLSGGIDSSAIAYYAAKNSSQKIKTFSIGFKEASFDESTFAREAAVRLKTEHHERILSADDALDLIPRIYGMLDEPMADASLLPTYMLSQFTREHVTVALGGDGGDELFCGYDTFLAHRFALYYDLLPATVKSAASAGVNKLPTSFSNISLDFKLKRFAAGFDSIGKYRDQSWMGSFGSAARQQLLSSRSLSELAGSRALEDIDSYLNRSNITARGSEGRFQELTLLYLRLYMMDQILVKVDRASMYNSLEVRAPFLDTAVVDFATTLPLKYKLRGLTTKYLLKRLMAYRLPHDSVYRKKKGFGIPLANWLCNQLKPLVREMLDPARLDREGLFNGSWVARLTDDHFARRSDNRKQIWTLLTFQMWNEKWQK